MKRMKMESYPSSRVKRMKTKSYPSQASVKFPDDLWIEILARVPINLILKFRSLSKFHRDLINSPNFIEKHSNVPDKPSSSWGYVILSSRMKNYWAKKLDLTNSDPIVLHRLSPPHGNFECVGCCEGILLLRSPECIMLWNPLTGASRSFPHVRRPNEFIEYSLGQDQVTADLKILKIVQRLVIPNDIVIDCEIYSSKSDTWRKVIKSNRHLKLHRIRYPMGAAFVEGTSLVHMVAIESETLRNQVIVSFDFSTEKFNRIFHLPPGASRNVYVSSLDGCLCFYEKRCRNGALRVWTMKEYGVMESWAPVLSLKNCSPGPEIIQLMQHDFLNDGRQILLLSNHGLQLFDLEEKELRKVSFVETSWLEFLNRCFVYTPSLRPF